MVARTTTTPPSLSRRWPQCLFVWAKRAFTCRTTMDLRRVPNTTKLPRKRFKMPEPRLISSVAGKAVGFGATGVTSEY